MATVLPSSERNGVLTVIEDPPSDMIVDGPEPSKSPAPSADGDKSTNADDNSEGTYVSFPMFHVTRNDALTSTGSPAAGKSIWNLKPHEMSPEVALIEFISTSASYHFVRKQNIKQLEWDILKVFPNNVMPANAAAWYMAKRRFYLSNAWEYQLLPFLLKKYPDKFLVKNNNVEFLETYTKEIARKKMMYICHQGLYAYFSHKVDEYGVYFFDPYYYENTEPFHANLRLVTNIHGGMRSKLIPTFFRMYSKQFIFQQHSPYLVTISKQPAQVKVNTTGVIVSMINNSYGIIQFPSGSNTEKALFCAKSLFRDGWEYSGDPMKLPAMEFDGYKVPGSNLSGKEYSWYAVLVWCGRKPSPKYCSTKEDLTSSQYFQHQPVVYDELSAMPQPIKVDDSMMVGEVVEIRKNGAIVTMGKDSEERAFIPGWRFGSVKRKGFFLTTTQGVGLAPSDLVAYYLEPSQQIEGFAGVGCNVIILRHADSGKTGHASGVDMTRPKEFTALQMLKNLVENEEYQEDDDHTYDPGSSLDSSEYESFDEADDVSDSELKFLEAGIDELIREEDTKGKDHRRVVDFLQKVQNKVSVAIRSRLDRAGRTSPDSGFTTEASPGLKEDKGAGRRQRRRRNPKVDGDKVFKRTIEAFKCLDKYDSGDDPDFEPVTTSESDDTITSSEEEVASDDEKIPSSKTQRRTRRVSYREREARPLITPYWAAEIVNGTMYCPHTKKWLSNPEAYDSDRDQDFHVYETDDSDVPEDEEITEEEVKTLLDDQDTEVTRESVMPPKEDGVTEKGGDDEKETEKAEEQSSDKAKLDEKKEDTPKEEVEKGEKKKSEEEKIPEQPRRPRTLPNWYKFLAEDEVAENDEYDSEFDPEFYFTSHRGDIDVDLDEFSDGEIPEEEVAELVKEAEEAKVKMEPPPEIVGECNCIRKHLELVAPEAAASTETPATTETPSTTESPTNDDVMAKENAPEAKKDDSPDNKGDTKADNEAKAEEKPVEKEE